MKAKRALSMLFAIILSCAFLGGCASAQAFRYGIESDGEIFYEYFYIELDSDKISQVGYDTDQVKRSICSILDTTDFKPHEEEVEANEIFYYREVVESTLKKTDKEGNGERRATPFYYIYDIEYHNPLSLLLKSRANYIYVFFLDFPLLLPLADNKELEFSIGFTSPYYKTNAHSKQIVNGLYASVWKTTLSDLLEQNPSITIRQYRVNTDGWYILAFSLGALFIVIVLLKEKRKKNIAVNKLTNNAKQEDPNK